MWERGGYAVRTGYKFRTQYGGLIKYGKQRRAEIKHCLKGDRDKTNVVEPVKGQVKGAGLGRGAETRGSSTKRYSDRQSV